MYTNMVFGDSNSVLFIKVSILKCPVKTGFYCMFKYHNTAEWRHSHGQSKSHESQ